MKFERRLIITVLALLATISVRAQENGRTPSSSMFLNAAQSSNVVLPFDVDGEGKRYSPLWGLDQAWHHVAVTMGQGQTVINLDGEAVASTGSIKVTPASLRPTMNYLGRAQNNSVSWLNAYFDDVRFYNYALSAEEIKSLADNAASGISQLRAEDTASDTPSKAYYTFSGQRVDSPQASGVYILQQGQKSRKVFISR